jgi:hypothetical protein
MREANWQVLDKDAIIDLIVKHNASTDTLAPDVARRVRGKLENMDAGELWAHIRRVYGGVLWEPDPPVPEMRRPKWKPSVRKPVVKALVPVIRAESNRYIAPKSVYSLIETAENEIFGKNCVHKVFRQSEQLVVLCHPDYMKRLNRWVAKHYPTVNITILEGPRT